MISETAFDKIIERAKGYKYSSMNYIEYDDCQKAEVLLDSDSLILLRDKSRIPAMLYFAAGDFEPLIRIIADIPGKLRLHFVPREYAAQLQQLGFIEWGEYVDFFNYDLPETAARYSITDEAEYLNEADCEEASIVSQRCRLQSRGFEGESKEWFAKWLTENKVLVLLKDSAIIGFCCVSIYNEGTTLWIREIAVDPAYQGMGFGKKLMEQAIRYGVNSGAVKGFLAADILNANAIAMYEKYGFFAKGSDSELQMVKE